LEIKKNEQKTFAHREVCDEPVNEKVYDTEILKIIKQLHKSWREVWKKKEKGRLLQHNKQ